MPDPWMPGLRHDPGRSAGYSGGNTDPIRMQWCKHHDTAGTNSYDICKWGRQGYNVSLCQILLPKNGIPWQFCEINARCADSGDWNGWGPGIEVERLGAGQAGLTEVESLTTDQAFWLGKINAWLASEWGLPDVQYRGPQFGAEGFRGHVNHRDIAYNPDGLSPAEWDHITNDAPTQPDPPVEDIDMYVISDPKKPADKYVVGVEGKRHIMSVDEYRWLIGPKPYGGGCSNIPTVSQGWFDSIKEIA